MCDCDCTPQKLVCSITPKTADCLFSTYVITSWVLYILAIVLGIVGATDSTRVGGSIVYILFVTLGFAIFKSGINVVVHYIDRIKALEGTSLSVQTMDTEM